MAYIYSNESKNKAWKASEPEQSKGGCWTLLWQASNIGRTSWSVQHTKLSLGRDSRPKGVQQIAKLHGNALLCMQDLMG